MWLKLLLRLLSYFQGSGISKPKVPVLAVSSNVIRDELASMNLKLMYPVLLDDFQDYYYTTLAGWQDIIRYIEAAFDFPKPKPPVKDCDYFALLFKALVETYFNLNACGFVVGPIPLGNHAFNLLRTDDGYYLWEPDPELRRMLGIKGPFRINDEHKYQPEYILQ